MTTNFPPGTRVRWPDGMRGTVVERPADRSGTGAYVLWDGWPTPAHMDPRCLTRADEFHTGDRVLVPGVVQRVSDTGWVSVSGLGDRGPQWLPREKLRRDEAPAVDTAAPDGSTRG